VLQRAQPEGCERQPEERAAQAHGAHLDQVLQEVQSNPRGVLTKAPAKEVEVKP